MKHLWIINQLVTTNTVWMPEIGLGIGSEWGNYGGVTREWLYWYAEDKKRYFTPNERFKEEIDRSNKLAAKLRQLGSIPMSKRKNNRQFTDLVVLNRSSTRGRASICDRQ